jgi:hypothetical protein
MNRYDMNRQDTFLLFVPIDARTLEPEQESVVLEAFAGSIAGCTLGLMGLEHLAHLVDMSDMLGQFQDAIRPQITQGALRHAINAYRMKPTPFPPGTTPGVWVPISIPSYRLDATIARLYPELGVNWRQAPKPAAADVPWRKTRRCSPRFEFRPPRF